MRRRSPTSSPSDHMEKGVKNQQSRICLLASLAAFFWFLLLYFHFAVLGGSTVDDSTQLNPISVNIALTNARSTNTQPRNAEAPPIGRPMTNSPPTNAESGNTQPPPIGRPMTTSPPTSAESGNTQPPPISRPVTNIGRKSDKYPFMRALRTIENKSDPCGGRYIFVHDLPPRFNEDMLKECKSLSLWTNMCKFTTNAGLGPPLENVEGVFSNTGWYATNQFAVDVIFSNRMKQYDCLTRDPSLAAAFFVPFYAGFDIARYLWGYNISTRDAASLDLANWLMKRPEWSIMDGKDHFLVAGRITWDFRRLSDEESDWGNKLLFLPAAKNMSMLVVESSPWNANDFGIPYPTYFHPAKDADVFVWQDRMRKLERKWLFSFAGAPRPDNPKSIRGQIIDQCKTSKVGKLLECDFGESKCHSPGSIMQMFQSSLFCLQPQGDSYTRRSAFDSMLAGCIPVFFHPGSAYTQYTWHLPRNYSKYSVFITEDDIRKRNVSIEQRLSQISPEQVRIMREEVISLIPRLIYADPRSKLETLKDAFDGAVQAVIDKVTKLRRDIIEGRTDENFIEEISWKYALLDEGQREVGPHEWDPFFSKPKNEALLLLGGQTQRYGIWFKSPQPLKLLNFASGSAPRKIYIIFMFAIELLSPQSAIFLLSSQQSGLSPSVHQSEFIRVRSQVCLGITSSSFTSKLNWHLSFLRKTVSSEEDPSSRLLYSYHSAMEGFSASLSETELKYLQKLPDVIAIRPDRLLQIHTTYSYKFLGLNPTEEGGWFKSGFGQEAIIGVLDTGVWPESPSFNDRGMPPVPKKWRGICQEGQNFNSSYCNRKLIGARFFSKGHRVASISPSLDTVREYLSPRDSHGHGTHTSSTAGGAPVPMANVLGNGAGVAQGMAPNAHIAIYKVCWFNGCYSSDILAGMDVAIRDGVDILSLSLGGFPLPIYEDSIAIGSFRAMEHKITVICAAGNSGPLQSSVANEAPWIATIGASTTDRRFPAIVRLGDGKFLYGESMYPGNLIPDADKELEVVYGTGGNRGSEYCLKGSLLRANVQGKMVVCDRGVNGRAEKGQVVKEASGAAMILANTEINLEEDSVDVHVLPATLIGFAESVQLKSYINSTRRPRAQIEFGGIVIGRSRAPAVAQFSSRGPSFTNPSILKPDMIAPGVNIIAAWPQNLGPTGLPEDSRRVNFTVMSGTSMACPHVSGIAALIHSTHPKWTPAAVKSAIMTTADVTDHSGEPIMDGNKPAGLFAIGAGHVNPERAITPGLIYDIRPDEYITHLCTIGYTRSEIFTITHKNVSCHEILQMNRGFSLNYPSISVIFRSGMTSKMIKRRLTNVGSPNSTYSVEVMTPEGVKVRVKPQRLIFKHINQSLSYKIWFISRKRTGTEIGSFEQGHLTWVHSCNSIYRVRSPIVVTWAIKKQG
ncbi:hypothetical protein F0562_021078 [Nyssa sinensis]|uniref:Exostosin GT47 domain-containing protein n=1 Tax=Nyssa sinensis TaxID=561372 RepID=A0A5J5BNM6_9ASTE|nr:hypothetical protein F0562_021078 [Nyssa sinensis]